MAIILRSSWVGSWMGSSAGSLVTLACLLPLGAAPALAQTSSSFDVPAEPRFAIKALKVEGASLVPDQDIERVTAAFVGPDKTFADLRRAVQAVEELYAAHGFKAVKAILPEQEAAGGVFRIRIIETKLGSVIVNGNQHFTERQIRAVLPGLQEGESPDMIVVSHQLQLANENPARQAAVVLKEGRGDALVDAVVQVADQDPLRTIAYVDNSGTSATGYQRTGIALQHANVWGRDHVASFQAATSPDHISDVAILAVGYRIPLYALGDSVEFNASYSDVNSGHVEGAGSSPALDISGSGSTLGLTYNHLLDPLGDWRHRVSATLEQKEFKNNVIASGTSLVPNLADRPFTLSYGGTISSAEGQRDFHLSASFNLPGTANNSTQAYNQFGGRAGATGQFAILRWSGRVIRQFSGDWSLTGSASGQWTRDALISGEQFGLGGAQSVRGFEERVLANDQGLRTSLELQAPDQAGRLGLANASLHPLVFWDFGHVWRNNALPGETDQSTIASVGAGLRLFWNNRLSLTADYGVVAVPGAGRKQGDGRLHASLVALF